MRQIVFLGSRADVLSMFGVETDSPLAPLILWDVAHAASRLARRSRCCGDASDTSYLQRDYFASSSRGSLRLKTGDRMVFRKHSPLLAEQDSGLDAWTFGIPVGSGGCDAAQCRRRAHSRIEHREEGNSLCAVVRARTSTISTGYGSSGKTSPRHRSRSARRRIVLRRRRSIRIFASFTTRVFFPE